MNLFTKGVIFSLAVSLAAPAVAEGVLDGEAFDAYTRGKTLFYGQDGAAYGAERYFADRRVQWTFLDGECKEGEWYEQAGQICFVYEDNPDPQCWTFRKNGDGLTADFKNVPGMTELYEASDLDEEMICLAPNLGV
ncbi:hypothetical protein [Roseobacter ponti]|uniref:DUF995 domain-containing protein n=1 Tax=Roseobacter ponti TaxID=1891787 RepID=A0A858SVM1_9RHOB|nr:hypothetical protein [Roseobacter ponti]QJF52038.1 hypothetical protein G3256_13115 [Roseobacter ponti]